MIELAEKLRVETLKQAIKRRRQARLHNWSWRCRKKANTRRMERFALDVNGDPATVQNEQRIMRNARKRERQGR